VPPFERKGGDEYPYRLDNPTIAVRENGTYGGQGKAVGCVPPTALLFVVPERISSCWRFGFLALKTDEKFQRNFNYGGESGNGLWFP